MYCKKEFEFCMALINCKECGKEVSDTSKRCIHCGAKIKKEKTK